MLWLKFFPNRDLVDLMVEQDRMARKENRLVKEIV